MTEKQRIALQVVDLAKALALADNHFLSAAVGRLRVEPSQLGRQFATDGYILYYDTERVLQRFKQSRVAPRHDLLHSVIHCVFLHPYVSPSVEQGLWDLACDIAVERAVMELCGQRDGACGMAISSALQRIERDLQCRPTAEKVYARLREGMWADRLEAWMALFCSDAHDIWYAASDDGPQDEKPDSEGEAGQGADRSQDAEGSGDGRDDQGAEVPSGASSGSGQPDDGAAGGGLGEGAGPQRQDGRPEEGMPGNRGTQRGTFQGSVESAHQGYGMREVLRPSSARQQEEWRQVATSLAINLQTMSAKRGGALGGFVDDLEAAAQERVDYAEFLRQFAITGEVMRLSDDEFDYIFYTYGMKLYGNLPLVEPLEYREEKRVREFAIVIDTSGSVQGDIVRRFIDATFDILSSTESFFQRVNLHIIQCDAEVQSDDVIRDMDELREWGRSMKLLGSGGTDFRPAFEYVDFLVESGAFENLGGLVYFTDGYGRYPDRMPDYRSAFVFYDEDYRAEDVPPWAVQIVLDKDAIKQSSTIGR